MIKKDENINLFWKNIILLLNIISFLLIILSSSYLTYFLLDKYLTLYNKNLIIVKEYVNIENKIKVNEIEALEDNSIDIIKDHNNINYNKMKFNDVEFLLSSNEDAYNYWFITKNLSDNKLYLYSHNSYRYTENSGKYFYNNAKYNDIIEFDDGNFYKISKTEMIDVNKDNNKKLTFPKNSDVVYFTCTPYWDNTRKLYFLEKIK